MQNLSKYGSKKCEFCQESVDFKKELRQKNVNHDCGKNCEYRGKKVMNFVKTYCIGIKNLELGSFYRCRKKMQNEKQ